MTMITPSYLGETIEYSSLHACRSTLEDPTLAIYRAEAPRHVVNPQVLERPLFLEKLARLKAAHAATKEGT